MRDAIHHGNFGWNQRLQRPPVRRIRHRGAVIGPLRPLIDPIAERLDLRGAQAIFPLRRHGAIGVLTFDELDQQALGGLARYERDPGIAAPERIGLPIEAQPRLLFGRPVAGEARSAKDWFHVAHELERLRRDRRRGEKRHTDDTTNHARNLTRRSIKWGSRSVRRRENCLW